MRSNSSSLNILSQSATDTKMPGTRHDCKECFKSFDKKHALVAHMRIHSGGRNKQKRPPVPGDELLVGESSETSTTYRCRGCHREYKYRTRFIDHLSSCKKYAKLKILQQDEQQQQPSLSTLLNVADDESPNFRPLNFGGPLFKPAQQQQRPDQIMRDQQPKTIKSRPPNAVTTSTPPKSISPRIIDLTYCHPRCVPQLAPCDKLVSLLRTSTLVPVTAPAQLTPSPATPPAIQSELPPATAHPATQEHPKSREYLSNRESFIELLGQTCGEQQRDLLLMT